MGQLSNIKKLMFDKHVKFLNNKAELIRATSFKSYYNLQDYINKARNPMYDEINTFESKALDLYNVNSDLWYNMTNELRKVVADDFRAAKNFLK